MDDMIVSLIKSRYTNLDEYKDKILKGTKLPTYIQTLLKENNFWPEPIDDSKTKLTDNYENLILNASNLIENLNLNEDINVFDFDLSQPLSNFLTTDTGN